MKSWPIVGIVSTLLLATTRSSAQDCATLTTATPDSECVVGVKWEGHRGVWHRDATFDRIMVALSEAVRRADLLQQANTERQEQSELLRLALGKEREAVRVADARADEERERAEQWRMRYEESEARASAWHRQPVVWVGVTVVLIGIGAGAAVALK